MDVVVKTDDSRVGHIGACIESLVGQDVHVVKNGSFELGGINWAYHHGMRRFLFLQDSCRVLSAEFWDIIDKYDSCLIIPRPSCYLAVFDGRVLDMIKIPTVPAGDKEMAIYYETVFMDDYAAAHQEFYGHPIPVLFPEITDQRALDSNNIRETIDGPRLHLENIHFLKMKATYR